MIDSGGFRRNKVGIVDDLPVYGRRHIDLFFLL